MTQQALPLNTTNADLPRCPCGSQLQLRHGCTADCIDHGHSWTVTYLAQALRTK